LSQWYATVRSGGVAHISTNESIPVYEWSDGKTSVHVEVYVDSTTGALVLAGQDLGEAPKQYLGKSEYEYFLSVKAADKDRLLLYLVQALLAGNETPNSALREWLTARGIPFQSASF